MTFEFFKAVTPAVSTGISYMWGGSNSQESLSPKLGNGEDPLEFDKILESITTCIALTIIGMMELNTKLGVAGNRITYFKPIKVQGVPLQGVVRRYYKVGHNDFEKHKILIIAIDVPQTWFPIGSEMAKSIARIHLIMLTGLHMLKNTYAQSTARSLLNVYIAKCIQFYQANFPDKKLEEFLPEGIDLEGVVLTENKLADKKFTPSSHKEGDPKEKQLEKETAAASNSEKDAEEDHLQERESTPASSTKTEFEEDKRVDKEAAPSLSRQESGTSIQAESSQVPHSNPIDIKLSASQKAAMSLNIVDINKKMWMKKQSLEMVALLVEETWSHYLANDSECEHYIAALENLIAAKVGTFQEKLEKDQKSRYRPQEISSGSLMNLEIHDNYGD